MGAAVLQRAAVCGDVSVRIQSTVEWALLSVEHSNDGGGRQNAKSVCCRAK